MKLLIVQPRYSPGDLSPTFIIFTVFLGFYVEQVNFVIEILMNFLGIVVDFSNSRNKSDFNDKTVISNTFLKN